MTIPIWLTVLAWSITGIGMLCGGMILIDIYRGGYRQPMKSWEAVWPITAIYAGPLALVAYYRWGRPATPKWQQQHGPPPELGLDTTAAVETIPGGAASFVGHLIAVPIVVATGVTIAGKGVWPMILLIAAFALPLLIAFEYRSLTQAGQIRSAGLRTAGGAKNLRAGDHRLRYGHGRRDADRGLCVGLPAHHDRFLVRHVGRAAVGIHDGLPDGAAAAQERHH